VWPDGTVCERFAFAHQMYKQVIYERLPGARAARLHRSIAERLEQGYADQAASQAAELAWHYGRGFDARKAVTYLELAADQALSRNAHREAIQHLRAALEMLPGLPEGRERAERELSLQAKLAPALIVIQGWSSVESEQAFNRGLALCEHVPGHPMRYLLTFALGALYEYRAEYHRSQQLMEARVGEHRGDGDDASYLIESYDLLACSLFHQGKFTRALKQAELGLDLYELYPNDLQLFASFGEHPAVEFLGWEALALAFLGRMDEALACAHEALGQAQANVYSLATAQCVMAWIYQLQGSAEQTRIWAESSLQVAAEYGFPYRVAVGKVFRGWALTALGSAREGLEDIHTGLESIRVAGAMIQYPYFLALQADAHLRAGDLDLGLQAIETALSLMSSDRTFFYESELRRLHAELLLRIASPEAVRRAEAELERAIEIARAQGASILEGRARETLSGVSGRLERPATR
jgi:adenylate cyclase